MTKTYQITEGRAALNRDWVCSRIRSSYWGGWLTDELIMKSCENSLCFGVYVDDVLDSGEIAVCGEQIGFGRAVTDGVTFSSLMDIYIEEKYRNRGLGTRLIETMLAHPMIKPTICTISTLDQSLYYEKFGWIPCGTVLKRDPQ